MADCIDLATIIDKQKFGSFHLTVVSVSFFLMLVDGYDNISIAYIAPLLIRQWGVDKSVLGPLFSAGLFGGLFGPPLFGYLADRFGRKFAVILGAFFFGLFTLAQVWANSLGSMMALRFIAGIGIGGVLPITVALNTEFAPRRIRASMTMLSFVGVALGGALGGLVASMFMGTYGWQVIFWTGGIVPMLVSVVAIRIFPESLKFLSLKPRRREELIKVLGKLSPGTSVPQDAQFVLGDEENRTKFAFKDLLEGRLAWITPLFWIANVISLLVFFFVNQWTPVLLASTGISVARCALHDLVHAWRFCWRGRDHASDRQTRSHSSTHPVCDQHSCSGSDRVWRSTGMGHHGPGLPGRFLFDRASIRHYRDRKPGVPDLHPFLGRRFMLCVRSRWIVYRTVGWWCHAGARRASPKHLLFGWCPAPHRTGCYRQAHALVSPQDTRDAPEWLAGRRENQRRLEMSPDEQMALANLVQR